MSIQELFLKIKSFYGLLNRNDFFTAVSVILIVFSAFGLGRLSVLASKNPILIKSAGENQLAGAGNRETKNEAEKSDGSVLASKTGTKYHFPWCAGAKSIKEENKIWFKDAKEAKAAGYEPAGNCKGLPQ